METFKVIEMDRRWTDDGIEMQYFMFYRYEIMFVIYYDNNMKISLSGYCSALHCNVAPVKDIIYTTL